MADRLTLFDDRLVVLRVFALELATVGVATLIKEELRQLEILLVAGYAI
jgi:hypothetical protein